MTVYRHEYTAYLVGNPDRALSMRGGRVSLDSSSAPHVQMTLDIAYPGHWEWVGGLPIWVTEPGVLDALDPRNSPRVRVRATRDVGNQQRDFNLGVRDWSVDLENDTVTLTLASDEAVLTDFAPLTDDEVPFSLTASLRSVVNYVLNEVGLATSLAASPALDANVTPIWDVTNLLLNPNVAVNTANWSSVGANNNYASGVGATGVNGYLNSTATSSTWQVRPAATTSFADAFNVTPGEHYTFAPHLRSPQSPTARPTIAWYDERGNIVGYANGTTTALNPNWSRLPVTGKAPYNAYKAAPYVQFTGASGNQVHIDATMFYAGRFLVPYFDGTTTSTTTYGYSWAGDPHASTSSRESRVDGPAPEAFVWDAGTNAMEFLAPILQARGWRLVCDEARVWTIRDETYEPMGNPLSLRYGVNIVSADEVISRDAGLWFDARLTRYRWRRGGVDIEQTDAYALSNTPTRTTVLDLERPYPGAGRSQYAVRRAQGMGREVTVSAIADWSIRAEQGVSVNLRNLAQFGRAVRVDFDFDSDLMTIATRTVDTPAGAINLLTGTINGLTGTINQL